MPTDPTYPHLHVGDPVNPLRNVRYAIADTSAIIYTDQLGLLDVWRLLFERVLVPFAVMDELIEGFSEGIEGTDPRALDWMEIRDVPTDPTLRRFPRLDPGETAALSLALTFPADQVTLLLDDRDARDAAGALGLDFTGVLGVLLAAKRERILTEVKPLLAKLNALGFRMTPDLVANVLKKAGED